MSDLAYRGLSDDGLRSLREHARFRFLMAQTPELRKRLMQEVDEITAEQERRRRETVEIEAAVAGAFLDDAERGHQMNEEFELAMMYRDRDLGRHFAAIRRIHQLNKPKVDAGVYNPNIVDWRRLFTPIELEAWLIIREIGLRMFPQYPVGKHFADFADPWAKVAIECDGKAFHDAERDRQRDAQFHDAGWAVIRLPGRDLVRDHDDPESPYDLISEATRALGCVTARMAA